MALLIAPASGFGGAEIVVRRVLEERAHVAERGGAGAQHVGVLHRVHELVELGRIEAALQADAARAASVTGGGARRCRRRRTSSRCWEPCAHGDLAVDRFLE